MASDRRKFEGQPSAAREAYIKAMSNTMPPGWVDVSSKEVLRAPDLAECFCPPHEASVSAPTPLLAGSFAVVGGRARIYAVLSACVACWLVGWLSFVHEGRFDDAEAAFEILPLGIVHGLINILHWLGLI